MCEFQIKITKRTMWYLFGNKNLLLADHILSPEGIENNIFHFTRDFG